MGFFYDDVPEQFAVRAIKTGEGDGDPFRVRLEGADTIEDESDIGWALLTEEIRRGFEATIVCGVDLTE